MKFSDGFGLAMYWETLARWISRRARRDAKGLGVPLVFLQSADECNTMDKSAAQRLLHVANIHATGHMHGVLPAHVGMRVRFTVSLTPATIVGFLFKDEDKAKYEACDLANFFDHATSPLVFGCRSTT